MVPTQHIPVDATALFFLQSTRHVLTGTPQECLRQRHRDGGTRHGRAMPAVEQHSYWSTCNTAWQCEHKDAAQCTNGLLAVQNLLRTCVMYAHLHLTNSLRLHVNTHAWGVYR
jgi:hypothetical protein